MGTTGLLSCFQGDWVASPPCCSWEVLREGCLAQVKPSRWFLLPHGPSLCTCATFLWFIIFGSVSLPEGIKQNQWFCPKKAENRPLGPSPFGLYVSYSPSCIPPSHTDPEMNASSGMCVPLSLHNPPSCVWALWDQLLE